MNVGNPWFHQESPPSRIARLASRPASGPQAAPAGAGPPALSFAPRGPLAQLVEQGTLNPKVEGSNPSRPIAERPATGERSHGARGKSLPAFGASLLDLATEHRVKLGELGRPVGDRANYRFALGGIEVDVKRSRAERSFHLGSDGRVSGPAESRDQLRYVVSIYWHTSHVDVVPQRHGERVSPARTIKTRAGGQRSLPSGVGASCWPLASRRSGAQDGYGGAASLRPSRFGSPLAEAFNRLGGRASFPGAFEEGASLPVVPSAARSGEAAHGSPPVGGGDNAPRGAKPCRVRRRTHGCPGDRVVKRIDQRRGPGWASPSDLSHAGSGARCRGAL